MDNPLSSGGPSTGPSTPRAFFPEGPAFFRGTFHAGGRFPGRSFAFPGNLPCQRPFSWKVPRFSGGPSTLEGVFLEGPAFFRGTFHARGHFPGRSLGPASNLANTAVTGPSRDRAWLLGGERKRADPEGPALKVLVWGKTTWRRDRYDGRHGRHDDPGLRRGLRHGWSWKPGLRTRPHSGSGPACHTSHRCRSTP